MAKPILSQECLKKLFDYRDGHLYWKNSTRNGWNGKKAGTLTKKGYWNININNNQYKAHRLIFMLHHGYLPKLLDHADGNKLNNKIENLRAISHRQNLYNRGANKNSKSGVKNVSWCKKDKKWVVQINGKHIGQYIDLELAMLVAQEARDKYHGAFAKHN
jgi:hypothetical protein